MYVVRIDVNGGQQLKPPTDDEGIITLCQNVLKAEHALPDPQRFPRLDLLEQRLAVAQTGLQQAVTGKTEKTSVAITVECAQDDAYAALRKIISGLTYHHLEELPVLAQWGLEVVKGGRGNYQVRAPRKQDDMLNVLKAYIAREEQLPAADRLSAPTLDEVKAIHTAWVNALEQRATARTLQEQGTLIRTQESAALYDLLQLVAHYHITLDFGGVVDARLQSMGFDVVAVPPKAPKAAKVPAEGPAAPAEG